MGETKLNRML